MVVLLGLVLPALAPAVGWAGESDVLGRYWLPDRDGQFEIYRQGGRFFGRVVAYDVEGQLDEKNPEPALRSRPFVGIDMFQSFRFEPDSGRWVDGSIYDASSGTTYDAYLWFEEDRPDVLLGRGFVGFSLLGRTERFERVGP